MTIDIKELREAIQTFESQAINEDDLNELINRIEAAEQTAQDYLRIDREKAQIAQQLVQAEISKREISEAHNAVTRRLSTLADENTALRSALEKIADWDSAWGPFPETNKAWRAMAIVTAREAVPRRGEKK